VTVIVLPAARRLTSIESSSLSGAALTSPSTLPPMPRPMNDGRIIERGEPERVLSQPKQPETQRFLRQLLEAGRL
jgi:ABC-type phosphonate transport system ATPase subunit